MNYGAEYMTILKSSSHCHKLDQHIHESKIMTTESYKQIKGNL